MIEVA